jgi:hypothetical protein
MRYFNVPLSKGCKPGGKSGLTQLSLVAFIARVIIYGNTVWIAHYEARTRKRSFSVLRR